MAGVACVVGAVLSLALFAGEVGKTPTYDVGKGAERRVGEVSSVTFTVKNNTGHPRCPEVHVAARDTESRTLAEVVASPPAGVTAVPAHGSVTLTASLHITGRDYQEKLHEIRPYVFRTVLCPSP
jgi:hypothetical protein